MTGYVVLARAVRAFVQPTQLRFREYLAALFVALTQIGTAAAGPSLADYWNGQAVFVPEEGAVFGDTFHMHFLSTLWEADQLWAYYIRNDVGNPTGCPLGSGRPAVGLALTADAASFQDQGKVLDVGGAWQWVYQANGDLLHQIGRPDSCGWSASAGTDPPGYLSFGPFAVDIAPGPNTASFALLVDTITGSDEVLVTIDVHDATAGEILAIRDIRRTEFETPFQEKIFNLDYVQVENHLTELRTFWHDRGYVCQRIVAVSQGQVPFFDDHMASFPGVWKEGDTWYLVYEGSGTNCDLWPGDIGLATSLDGVTWLKDAANPILRPEADWESANIGTPSLWREGDTWYLFYHGFDGTDVQVGVATGTDLHDLTKSTSNPLLATADCGTWCAGTVGKRSITKEGSYYYMVFEGSTDQACCPEHPDSCPNFACARWSSGVARSTDLLHWTFGQQNPVIPQTTVGFGFDGPEWIRTPDGRIHVYFRVDGNVTRRATLLTDCDGNGVADEQELDLQTIHVDRGHNGCENGTGTYPFTSVAAGFLASTNGDTMLITAGDYAEAPILDRPVTIRATGGIVRIGGPGP